MIIDALKDRYPLPTLLDGLSLSRSSYYYQEAVFRQEDKCCDVRKKIMELFHENKGRYGYRRIHGLLKREGHPLRESDPANHA